MNIAFFFVTFLASFTSISLTRASPHYQTLPRSHNKSGSKKFNEQPLSDIAIHEAVLALHENASVKASPYVLGLKVHLYAKKSI